MNPSAADLYAELYDVDEGGWPGELDFYQELAATATARGEGVLEVACGTGRVAIPLAQDGARVTGFDSGASVRATLPRRSSTGSASQSGDWSPSCGAPSAATWHKRCSPLPSCYALHRHTVVATLTVFDIYRRL